MVWSADLLSNKKIDLFLCVCVFFFSFLSFFFWGWGGGACSGSYYMEVSLFTFTFLNPWHLWSTVPPPGTCFFLCLFLPSPLPHLIFSSQIREHNPKWVTMCKWIIRWQLHLSYRGLKALGVRDLTYRLAFLACSVQATNPRVSLCAKGLLLHCQRANIEHCTSLLTGLTAHSYCNLFS